ncbi:YcxB family protein [Clostridium intestinale]|nr:YcxB family protein [Clostridium intestinale]QLY78456.1 YcxB family protein [Clostridium intestinale]
MLNKRYNDSKSLIIFENTELYLKEEGICIINSIEEREVKYDSITRINIFDNYLFIIISKKQYFTIPLKAFNYKDDKSNFINLLEQKTSRKIVYEYPDALDYR